MSSYQKRSIFIALFALLACVLTAAGTWMVSSSPVFFPALNVQAASTQAPYFGIVELVKPTYTLLPTATATQIPLIEEGSTEVTLPIDTSIQVQETATPLTAYAEIIPDTPTPEYAAPSGQVTDPPETTAYTGNKYILVDISEQHMYVYEGDAIVFSFVSSTGMNNATKVGTFSVLDKIPSAYGATWDIWMPNWLGIYWAGSTENGIHALPILPNGAQLWAGYLGTPISYGCVVLGAYEAELLYYWADIGTPVEIQW
jgi:lipoprotein-anchoring transpeptidase ErfK/SrfK